MSSTRSSSANQSCSHNSTTKTNSQKSENSKHKSGQHKSCTRKDNDEDNNAGSAETFETLPYYQSKYGEFDETAITIQKTTTLPVVEAKAEKYTPIPYVFRLPDQGGTADITATVRCPPFYIQLDHTIAVVWSLYSSDEMDIPVGINQLQWALSFLKNVKDKDDSYPRDVQHCINSITDELINQYAQMAELDPSPKSSEDSMSFNPQADSTKTDVKDDSGDCTCNASSVRFADEVDTCSGASNDEACNKTPDQPFSATYNDMQLHNYNLRRQYNAQKKFDRQNREGVCNMSNNDTVNSFLNDMRKDQLKKILGELDRLHSIEEYIVNTDKDFLPYIDENDKELKEYLAKKMNACSNNDCEGKDNDKDKSDKKSEVSSSKNENNGDNTSKEKACKSPSKETEENDQADSDVQTNKDDESEDGEDVEDE